MRGWSDEQANDEQIFSRGSVAGGADGSGSPGRASVAVGSDQLDCKIGCTGETLRGWVRQAERDQGLHGGSATEDSARIKALERENRELRQANEILRKASAYFAQAELDRPFRK